MVISRRVVLGTGAATAVAAAALGGAVLSHRLDDVARSIGIEPRPQPHPADERLLARVAADQNALLAAVEATASTHPALALDPYVAISTAQATAVGVGSNVPDTAAPPAEPGQAIDALRSAYDTASRVRATDAARAISPALVRVLASMSAGLAQCADTIGDVR